jgi:NTP pyrophosphatase (non-canonical NTP hydrolase)
MNLKNEFQPIRKWAFDRHIPQLGDPKTQFCKLAEEVGELGKAIIEENYAEIRDAIGDCVVVLTNLATLSNMNIEDCINSAFNEIKDRKGKIKNGTFIKYDSPGKVD